MRIKTIGEIIVCAEISEGNYIYAPNNRNIIFDESVPWQETGKTIVQLSTGEIVFNDDSHALADFKICKLNEMQTSFVSRVSGSYICSCGWPMQFDRSDTLAVEGAIQLMKATGQHTGYLTDANDVTHYDLPLATIETVKLEMLGAYAACHARKQELRAAINAAQTKEDLEAIEISWPV